MACQRLGKGAAGSSAHPESLRRSRSASTPAPARSAEQAMPREATLDRGGSTHRARAIGDGCAHQCRTHRSRRAALDPPRSRAAFPARLAELETWICLSLSHRRLTLTRIRTFSATASYQRRVFSPGSLKICTVSALHACFWASTLLITAHVRAPHQLSIFVSLLCAVTCPRPSNVLHVR